MGLHKIFKIVALALAVIGVIFAVILISSGNEGMVDNMLYVAYVVLGLILALVLVFVLKGLASGNVKKTLISIGLFLAVALVAYMMSSGTDLDLQPFLEKGADVTESTSKNIGAGLYTFYVLALVAVATMAFSGVKKIMK